MRCKQCRQPGSPINNLLRRLDDHPSVTVLSACAGYTYEGHHNLPEYPFILFSVKGMKALDELWKAVFSRLIAPAYLTYNGLGQFMFEIEIPKDWPNRNDLLTSIWAQIDERVRVLKELKT